MKAKQIKLLRKWLKLTQEEFAQALGATVSTVNRWENNKNKPSKMALEKINMLQQEKEGINAIES